MTKFIYKVVSLETLASSASPAWFAALAARMASKSAWLMSAWRAWSFVEADWASRATAVASKSASPAWLAVAAEIIEDRSSAWRFEVLSPSWLESLLARAEANSSETLRVAIPAAAATTLASKSGSPAWLAAAAACQWC
jgi:hypothetical protein